MSGKLRIIKLRENPKKPRAAKHQAKRPAGRLLKRRTRTKAVTFCTIEMLTLTPKGHAVDFKWYDGDTFTKQHDKAKRYERAEASRVMKTLHPSGNWYMMRMGAA